LIDVKQIRLGPKAIGNKPVKFKLYWSWLALISHRKIAKPQDKKYKKEDRKLSFHACDCRINF